MVDVNELSDSQNSTEKAATKPASSDVDAALQFLRAEEGSVVAVNGQELLRRIDLMVMPLMFGAYLSQYFDKSLLNYAAVMGTTITARANAQQD